ncbi:MAG: glycosyltransferase family 4 protein [Clostridia bacterium]|nr:glycosyltransferase family 4 protein [Clostridia bacterium]
MNIGIFTDCYYPQINGVVTSTIILKEELEKRGHNVTIVTVKVPGYKNNEPGILRIPSVPFRKCKDFRIGVIYPFSVLRKIKRLNLDIIHTQTEFSVCLMARLIAKTLRIPVIHTYHTMYEDYTHYVAKHYINKKIATKLSKVGSRLYLNECASVIAPSEKTKNALRRYGVTNKIYTIPTGIKLDNFKKGLFTENQIETKRLQMGIQENEKVILSLGRIAEEKSIDVIIKAMKNIKDEPLRLIIVGDGPAKNDLEKLTFRLGLNHKILFTGKVPWEETGLYYQMSSLFISASKTETQGLTILEAMAAGVPTIVRQDDNIKELIKNNYNGVIFNEESELSNKILESIDNDDLRKQIVTNGLEAVYNLSAECFGYNVEEVYNRVLRVGRKIS